MKAQHIVNMLDLFNTYDEDQIYNKVIELVKENTELRAKLGDDKEIQDVIKILMPFAQLGGDWDMPAYHDLDKDTIVAKNSGHCITAGNVRKARQLILLLKPNIVIANRHINPYV